MDYKLTRDLPTSCCEFIAIWQTQDGVCCQNFILTNGVYYVSGEAAGLTIKVDPDNFLDCDCFVVCYEPRPKSIKNSK